MACEHCEEKDRIIERLLDRLQGHVEVPVEGISAMERLADNVEASDEDRRAKEMENMSVASEIQSTFRNVHLSGPYAHCTITEAQDGEA